MLDEADKMLSSAGIAEQLAEIRQALLGGGAAAAAAGGGGESAKASPSPSSPSPPPSSPRLLLQCVLVSATMPASVSRLASQWLGEGFTSVGVGGGGGVGEDESLLARLQTTNSSSSSSVVTQVVTVCAEHKKPAKLLKHLARARQAASSAGERHAPRVLVFANRIKTVKFVAEFLRAQERKQKLQLEEEEKKRNNKNKNKGSKSNNASSSSSSSTKIETLHGDRSQPERDAALAAFRAGKVTVLVATDVAARGLDVSGLRHVVNYDFPSTLESYEHRVGRAGRDGKGGHVASFFGRALAPLARGVVEFLQGHGQGVDPNLVRLAEAYEEARERMMEGVEVEEGEEEGEREAEDEDSEEGNDRERLRRSAAAKAAAAESKRGGAGKRKKKRKVDDDAAIDDDEGGKDDASDDDDEERAAAPVLGLYRKASGAGGAAKTSTAKTSSMASAAKKKEKRKAVPGRLRQKLRREKALRGEW